MRWLTRLLDRLAIGADRERGATATIVAILLSGGVIMGMLAVSVDLGNLTYERRQVQNGADATSLALAAECAKSSTTCSKTQVADLLGANARDGVSQYNVAHDNGACARTATTNLPACTSTGAIDDLDECPPLPAWLQGAGSSIPYVETYAKTDTLANGDKLFMPFSRVLAGGASGDKGTSACARAAWGPLGSSRPSLPLVIANCNWQKATDNNKMFMVSPPYTPGPSPTTSVPSLRDTTGVLRAPATFVTTIMAKKNNSDDLTKFPCNPELENPPGAFGPGGFGWLKTCGQDSTQLGCAGVTNPCYAPITGTGTTTSNPGASLPTDCKNYLATFLGKEVDVPIVTSVAGTGSNLTYTVSGISTFYFAGYHEVPSANPKSKDAYKGQANLGCFDASGNAYKSTCIWGWFTSPIRPVGTIDPGATPRGPSVVQPAG